MVETDRMFVDVCREYFPEVACALDDERVKIHYDDGLRFLRNKKGIYDLIINDSTDPFGHTEGLFTKEFYGSCYNALKDDGIMVYQHGSPFYDEDEAACRSMHRKAFRSFPHQPRLPGPHPHLSVGLLAVWLCIEKSIIPSRISSLRSGMVLR